MSETSPGGEDRRESPRVPMRFTVRAPGGGEPHDCPGDVSVGGAFLEGEGLPDADRLEITFTLPGVERTFRVDAERLGTRSHDGREGLQVRFLEPDTETELELARYLDELALGWE